MTFDADPVIRRLQTGALVWCVGATALSLAGWPSRLDIAAGIVAGGVLTAVSFHAIKSSIDAILGLPLATALPAPGIDMTSTPGPVPGLESESPTETPQDRGTGRRAAAPSLVKALAKMTGRYALLAVLAYVMIARLRLHPIGLVVGASSLVASAALEAGRWVTRPSRAR